MESNSNGATVPVKSKLPEFLCVHCNKSFGANYNLRQHTKQFHVGEELPVVRMGRTPKAAMSSDHTLKPEKSSGSRITKFQCAICNKFFAAKNTLKRHMGRFHVSPDMAGMEKKECKRPSKADSSIRQIRRLSNLVMEFNNVAEFEEWKKQEEDAAVARFVKVRGDYMKNNGTVTKAFYCHRSGHYTPLMYQPRRRVKIQGSCKAGAICPAAMIVKILPTGQVQVSYCSQHRGHEFEIAHIGLRKENRQQVIETEIESDSHFGSEVEVWEHQLVPHVTESQTIFDSLESQHPDIDIKRCLEYCDTTYSFFRSAMRHNPQIAELTSANFSRLKELITAIISKPK